MDHRLIRPLALTKIVGIFCKTATIDDACVITLSRPAGLTQIVNAGPHKITGYVVISGDELQHLLEISPAIAVPAEADAGGQGE